MNLDDLQRHLDRLFASRPDPREQAAGLRDALVEFKVGIGQLREALERTERELDAARRESVDYERRGKLAADIGDAETTRIAGEYMTKAHEKVDLLERKVIVQRDELGMAQRDYEATKQQYQSASRGIPLGRTAPAAADEDPTTAAGALDHLLLDQRARESAVEAQLVLLKKKLLDPT